MYYATLAIIMHIMLNSHFLSARTLNPLLMHTSLTSVSCVAALSSFPTGPLFPDVADHLEVLDCHKFTPDMHKISNCLWLICDAEIRVLSSAIQMCTKKQSNVNIFTCLKPENCNYLL